MTVKYHLSWSKIASKRTTMWAWPCIHYIAVLRRSRINCTIRDKRGPTSEPTLLDLKALSHLKTLLRKKGNFHFLTQKNTFSKVGDAKVFTRAGKQYFFCRLMGTPWPQDRVIGWWKPQSWHTHFLAYLCYPTDVVNPVWMPQSLDKNCFQIRFCYLLPLTLLGSICFLPEATAI